MAHVKRRAPEWRSARRDQARGTRGGRGWKSFHLTLILADSLKGHLIPNAAKLRSGTVITLLTRQTTGVEERSCDTRLDAQEASPGKTLSLFSYITSPFGGAQDLHLVSLVCRAHATTDSPRPLQLLLPSKADSGFIPPCSPMSYPATSGSLFSIIYRSPTFPLSLRHRGIFMHWYVPSLSEYRTSG